MSTTVAAAANAATKPFRIGMLGAGVVGGGVYELLQKTSTGHNNNISITKICVRDLAKPRDFKIDESVTTLTTNPSDLLADDIDCLVEVAGGSSGAAKDLVLKALQKGTSVVTANKALLFERWSEIEAAMAGTSAKLGFEAAVCGGIPIVSLLSGAAYQGDTIQSITGICNGTTNYMLSAMAQGADYDDVLNQAQQLGYAEADPTADVEGHDVRAKIGLMAQLAYGATLTEIPCRGISKIAAADFLLLKQLSPGSTIKLVGTASKTNNQDNAAAAASATALVVYVTPAVVPAQHELSQIGGCGNCVLVNSQNMGVCSYAGPGAGRYPTANSIVADVYRAADGTLPELTATKTTKQALHNTSTASSSQALPTSYTSQFYVRFSCTSLKKVDKEALAQVAESMSISILKTKECAGDGIMMMDNNNNDGDDTTLVGLLTAAATNSETVKSYSRALTALPFVTEEPLWMPVLSTTAQ